MQVIIPSDISTSGNSNAAGLSISKAATDLGRRMSKRSSPEELVAKHIMPLEAISQNFSPGLVAQKQALEQEKIKNSLNRKLSIRSTKDDLKLRNIIKGTSTAEENENFSAKQTQLKSILKKRPDRGLLKEMNILKGSDVNLAAAQKLEISSKLGTFLDERPNATSLKNAKILFFSDDIQVAATYKKSEYDRKPDDDLTFKRLTPQLKSQIRAELNQYKQSEMSVHADSVHNTCFH